MFKFFGKQIIKPYTYTAKSLGSSGSNIAKNIAEITRLSKSMGVEMKEGFKEIKNQPKRTSQDPRQAFEQQYVERGWNPESLETQRKNVANSQMVYMLYTVVSAVIGAVLANSVSAESVIFPMILTALALIAGAVFFAQALVMSWYKCQIDNRSLISWNQFAGRPDFWSNILNPYRRAPAIN